MSREQAGTIQEKEENLLVLLKKAQDRFGYVPDEFLAEVIQTLEISASEAYGVTTFYSFLSRKQLGKNIIRVCKSLPCHMKRSEMIVGALADTLGIKPGQTTPDGKFSLVLTNCIGACDLAPAMLVNSDLHGNLTPGEIARILKSYV